MDWTAFLIALDTNDRAGLDAAIAVEPMFREAAYLIDRDDYAGAEVTLDRIEGRLRGCGTTGQAEITRMRWHLDMAAGLPMRPAPPDDTPRCPRCGHPPEPGWEKNGISTISWNAHDQMCSRMHPGTWRRSVGGAVSAERALAAHEPLRAGDRAWRAIRPVEHAPGLRWLDRGEILLVTDEYQSHLASCRVPPRADAVGGTIAADQGFATDNGPELFGWARRIAP